MILRRLELYDFRSYDRFAYEPSAGLNLIAGSNGAGKTNLAEAIYTLSFGRSWRVAKTAPLLRSGAPFAKVRALIGEGTLTRTLEIVFGREERRILLNGKPIRRLSELSSAANVLLFAPTDTTLFSGSPGARRSFLDATISKRDPAYLAGVLRYGKLLDDRNALLKEEKADRTLLETITEQMILEAEPLTAARKRFVTETNEILTGLASALYGEEKRLQMIYRPFADGPSFAENARKVYQRTLAGDLLHKATSIGPHREDFALLLDGKDIALYGSQGQNRLAAIALKISPAFLKQDPGRMPIAVLDDVMSELDEKSESRLLGVLRQMGQVFLTSTDPNVQGATVLALPTHSPS